MKVITIIASLILTFMSCSGKKKTTESDQGSFLSKQNGAIMQNNIPVIKYEANSRGFAFAIKVENQILYVSRVRDFKDYEQKINISETDWKEIVSLTKEIELDKVKDLKWPTEKRYYDGAAHANIIFISEGVEYPANGFDHGFPPVEIEKLVNTILKLTEK
jgi:hypothetical protein